MAMTRKEHMCILVQSVSCIREEGEASGLTIRPSTILYLSCFGSVRILRD